MGRIVAGIEVPTVTEADVEKAAAVLASEWRIPRMGPQNTERHPTASEDLIKAANKTAWDEYGLWLPTAKQGFKRLCPGVRMSWLDPDLGDGRLETLTGYDHDTLQRPATWNVFLSSLTCAAELLHQAWKRVERAEFRETLKAYGLRGARACPEELRWLIADEREPERIAFVFALLYYGAEQEADRRQLVELGTFGHAAKVCEGAAILAGLSDADLSCALGMLRGLAEMRGAGNVDADAFSSVLEWRMGELEDYKEACRRYEDDLNEWLWRVEDGNEDAEEPVKPTFDGAKAVSELRRELDRLLDDAISPPQTGYGYMS